MLQMLQGNQLNRKYTNGLTGTLNQDKYEFQCSAQMNPKKVYKHDGDYVCNDCYQKQVDYFITICYATEMGIG